MILFGNQQNRNVITYTPQTITIGTQTWCLRNFSESTLIDGTVIPQVQDASWTTLTSAAWCNYQDNAEISAEYGKLYNWYACAIIDAAYNPKGYRVATQSDFTTLIAYLGGTTVAGKAMKEAGTAHWAAGNTGDNSSGFTSYGSGIRSAGSYTYHTLRAYFWQSTNLTGYNIRYNTNSITTGTNLINDGFSIRLIKI